MIQLAVPQVSRFDVFAAEHGAAIGRCAEIDELTVGILTAITFAHDRSTTGGAAHDRSTTGGADRRCYTGR